MEIFFDIEIELIDTREILTRITWENNRKNFFFENG